MPPSSPPARFDGRVNCFGGRVVSDLVHDFGAVGSGRRDSRADLHTLHGLDRHHRLRQPRVEFFVPLRVRAEAGDHVVRHNFENASDRVPGAMHDVHFTLHLGFRLGVNAAQGGIQIFADSLNLAPGRGARQTRLADGDHMAQHFAFKLAEQQLGNRARCHARGGFPRRRALQDVPRIMEIEFHGAGQVRVARARRGQTALGAFGVRKLFNGERLFPVGPVAILDAQGDGRADGLPVPHAGQEFDAVLFDFLAPAAAIAQLPPVQFPLHEFKVNGHTRGHAADPCNQRLTVRFPRSDKAKHGRLDILSDPARRVKRMKGPVARASACWGSSLQD